MRASVVLVLLVSAACATARVPDFPMRALAGPHVLRAELTVSAAGEVTKYAVYVRREGIPPWVLALADDTLGPGEDREYEVELYANGSRVYEVTRVADGQEAELSVREDGGLEYVERGVGLAGLPEPVRRALAAIAGFVPGEAFHRVGPAIDDYEVAGARGGKPRSARLLRDGTLVSFSRQVPGSFEVAEGP